MTRRPVLDPRQARIADKLLQVCDIVQRQGLGNRADVARVAARILPRVPDPGLAQAQQRTVAAEQRAADLKAENQRLRDLLDRATCVINHDDDWHPPHVKPWRVVELRPRRAAALTEMCSGATIEQAAQHLGVTYSGAVNLLNRTVHDVGATDRAQAVALACSGAVRVRVRGKRKDVA